MRESARKELPLLLTREGRVGLSTLRLLHLYLHPGALFEDTSQGPARRRAHALAYNCRMRWMLIAYVRRWATIAAALFLGIAPAEAVAILPAAAIAFCCAIAVIVAACTAVAYFLLGACPEAQNR